MNFSRDPHPSVDRKSHHKGNIGCVARDKEQSKDNSPFTRTIYLCTNARTRRPFSLHPNPKIPFNLVALMCLQKECFQSGISSFDSPSENWNSIRKNSKTSYERRHRNYCSLFAMRQDLSNERTFLLRLVSFYSLNRVDEIYHGKL